MKAFAFEGIHSQSLHTEREIILLHLYVNTIITFDLKIQSFLFRF